MNDAAFKARPDILTELTGASPHRAVYVRYVIVDKPSGKDRTFTINEVNGVSGEKLTFCGNDAGGEERTALIANCCDSTVIQNQPAGGMRCVSQPQPSRPGAATCGGKVR